MPTLQELLEALPIKSLLVRGLQIRTGVVKTRLSPRNPCPTRLRMYQAVHGTPQVVYIMACTSGCSRASYGQLEGCALPAFSLWSCGTLSTDLKDKKTFVSQCLLRVSLPRSAWLRTRISVADLMTSGWLVYRVFHLRAVFHHLGHPIANSASVSSCVWCWCVVSGVWHVVCGVGVDEWICEMSRMSTFRSLHVSS